MTTIPVYLHLQPAIVPLPYNFKPATTANAKSPQAETHLAFIVALEDPTHSLSRSTVTQYVPGDWLDVEYERSDWVEERLVEVINNGVEIAVQEVSPPPPLFIIKAKHRRQKNDANIIGMSFTYQFVPVSSMSPPEWASRRDHRPIKLTTRRRIKLHQEPSLHLQTRKWRLNLSSALGQLKTECPPIFDDRRRRSTILYSWSLFFFLFSCFGLAHLKSTCRFAVCMIESCLF